MWPEQKRSDTGHTEKDDESKDTSHAVFSGSKADNSKKRSSR
jgi:hypothetical protein